MIRPARALLFTALALTAAAYALALTGPFQFDDYATVAVDPAAQSIAAWWADVAHHVRPVTKLSFVFTHAFGAAFDHVPLGHRLGNLLIHLLAVVLSALLGARLLHTCAPAIDARSGAIAAAGAAMLFALHPLATEAVSYISGRSMALGTLLAFASLWAWIRWRTEARPAWLLLALVAAMAAPLARETALITPLGWLLWEMARTTASTAPWSMQRLRSQMRGIMLPLALTGGFAAWLLSHARYGMLLETSWTIALQRGAEPSFTLAVQYFAEGLALLRYPSIDPGVTPAMMGTGARVLIALALAALLGIAWRRRHSHPHRLFCLLWIALWLVPVYAVSVRHDAIAERHFYPAIWGVLFALSAEAVLWSRRHSRSWRPLAAAAALILLALTAVTLTRIADYRSEIALWEAALRSAPDKVRVLNNLGYAYMEAGRWDEAQTVLSSAVRIDPRDALAQDNLLTAEEREFGPVRWRRQVEAR